MVQADKTVIVGWVDDYTADLFSWAYHKTSNEDMAKDLVQETFLAASEKPGSFRGDSTPKTFLFSILNNKIIDYYRKKNRQPISMENHKLSVFFDENGDWRNEKKPMDWREDESNLLDDENFQSVLQDCIGKLPEKWNICITSKYLLEKKTEEICQELEITTSNYWQMMHRAKLNLRECIEKNWFKK